MSRTALVGQMVNGRTTHGTYFVVAKTKAIRGVNAFGVRPCGSSGGKLHYWPNAAAFNLVPTPDYAHELYERSSAGLSMGTYQGIQEMPWDQIGRLLGKLRAHGDFDVISEEDWTNFVRKHGNVNQRTGAALKAPEYDTPVAKAGTRGNPITD